MSQATVGFAISKYQGDHEVVDEVSNKHQPIAFNISFDPNTSSVTRYARAPLFANGK